MKSVVAAAVLAVVASIVAPEWAAAEKTGIENLNSGAWGPARP